MRRRRRNRGTWFPNLGTGVLDQRNYSGREFVGVCPADGTFQTTVSPLTLDKPTDLDFVSADERLASIIGSDYVLQRLVGTVFVSRQGIQQEEQAQTLDVAPAVQVYCGFFVARANDASSGGGPDTPIGSATPDEINDNYSPMELDTVREPWIWRRSWILGSVFANGTINTQKPFAGSLVGQPPTPQLVGTYPCSNVFYGSVADGPKLDSKVKRRVRQDDRLWFVVSIRNAFGLVGVEGFEASVFVDLDYRIFGSLRKASQTSAF